MTVGWIMAAEMRFIFLEIVEDVIFGREIYK
jgi:hypothetical protein